MSQASGYAAASAANLQLCRALLMITLTSSVSTASILSSTVKPAAVTLIGFMCNKLLVYRWVAAAVLSYKRHPVAAQLQALPSWTRHE